MGSTNIFPAPELIPAPKLSASKGLRFRVGALVFHSGLGCRASGIRVKGLGFRAWAKSIPPILLAPQYGVTGALMYLQSSLVVSMSGWGIDSRLRL